MRSGPPAPATAALAFDLSGLVGPPGGGLRGRAAEAAMGEVARAARQAGVRRFDGPAGVDRAVDGDVTLSLHLDPAHDLDRTLRPIRERLEPGGRLALVVDGAAVLADQTRWTRACAARDSGGVAAVGLSVAPGGDALGLARRFKPDFIQVHAGLLDQRLIHSGGLAALADLGIAVQLRTTLLQGLLFLPREALPAGLADAGPPVSRARRAIAEAGADPLQAALAFVLHRPEAEAVIVEASSAGEVRALVAAAAAPLPELDWPSLALDHPGALNAEAELHRRVAA